MRYYSTNLIEDYPKSPFNKIKSIAFFYEGKYFDEIGMNVRGYIEYDRPLHPNMVKEYGFIVPANRVKFLEFIGTDSWGREVFEDEYGEIWKYASVDDTTRECHDTLYSSDRFNGEPDFPMSGEFDYKIVE